VIDGSDPSRFDESKEELLLYHSNSILYRQLEDLKSDAPLLVLVNKSDKSTVDAQYIAEFLELKVSDR
jgi:hypothetical protein